MILAFAISNQLGTGIPRSGCFCRMSLKAATSCCPLMTLSWHRREDGKRGGWGPYSFGGRPGSVDATFHSGTSMGFVGCTCLRGCRASRTWSAAGLCICPRATPTSTSRCSGGTTWLWAYTHLFVTSPCIRSQSSSAVAAVHCFLSRGSTCPVAPVQAAHLPS